MAIGHLAHFRLSAPTVCPSGPVTCDCNTRLGKDVTRCRLSVPAPGPRSYLLGAAPCPFAHRFGRTGGKVKQLNVDARIGAK